MTEKRYRAENIGNISPYFIVDNHTAKKKSDKITSFKAYNTNTKKKCEELSDLLNNYERKIDELKSKINDLRNELYKPMCSYCKHSKSIKIKVDCEEEHECTYFHESCEFFEFDEDIEII